MAAGGHEPAVPLRQVSGWPLGNTWHQDQLDVVGRVRLGNPGCSVHVDTAAHHARHH